MTELFDRGFSGKSVLVTGHTGFKGSWLCLWLARLGAKVTGYSWEPPTEPNHFTQSRIAQVLAAHHVADVRDTTKLLQVIGQCQPDLILHLAAQSVVRSGYRDPLETFSINVMGTASVLEAIRLWGQPCSVVLVTSDKCYENREQIWGYREIDAMGEHDPYGGSKGAAELVIRSYRDSFFPAQQLASHGVKVASARAGNVIGGGDWTSDALIVDVVKALMAQRPVKIRNPYAFRPWQHVLQALSGYLMLSYKLLTSHDPMFCSGWNIGPLPGNEIPVHDVVDRFIGAWGTGTWENANPQAGQREAGILRLSIDKALWNLGWKPGWDIQETIEYTAQWYRQLQSFDTTTMRELGLEQIAAYEARMKSLLSDTSSKASTQEN